MRTTTRKVIGLWLDTTSQDEAWIVSRDELDARGNAETTTTVSVHDDYDDARRAAVALADRDGRPVVTEGGRTEYEPEAA
jgi:hypothetical protein